MSEERIGWDAYFRLPRIQVNGDAELPVRPVINVILEGATAVDNEAFNRTDLTLPAEGPGGGGGGGGTSAEATGNLGDCTTVTDSATMTVLRTTGAFATILGFPAPAAGVAKRMVLIVATSGLTQVYNNAGVTATNGITLPPESLPTGFYTPFTAGSIVEFTYCPTDNRWLPSSFNALAAGALGAHALPSNSYQFRQADGVLAASPYFTQAGGYPQIGADRAGGAATSGELSFGALCAVTIRSANAYSGSRVNWEFLKHTTVFSGAKELITTGSATDGSRYVHQIHAKAGEWNKMTAGVLASGVYPAGAYALTDGAWLGWVGSLFGVFPNLFVAGSNVALEALAPDPLAGGKGYAFFLDVVTPRTGAINANGFALSPQATTHHPMVTIGNVDHNLFDGRRRAKVDLAGGSLDVSANKAVKNARSLLIVSTVNLTADIDLTLPGDTGTVTIDGVETSPVYFFLVRFDYSATTHKLTLKNGNSGTNVVTIGPDNGGDTGKHTAIVSSDADGVWMHGWSTDSTTGFKTATVTGT